MFHFCQSLFSLSLQRVRVSPGLDSKDTQLWISDRSQGASYHCLLQNLQMTDAAATAATLLHSGKTRLHLLNLKWLVRITYLAGQTCSPSWGLDGLFFLSLCLSKANISVFVCFSGFFFLLFISPLILLLWTVSLPSPDSQSRACTIPPTMWTLLCTAPPLCFLVAPLFPKAYLPTGRHGISHLAQISSLSSQLPPFMSTPVILALHLFCPQLSHLLGCHTASVHLALIDVQVCGAAHMTAKQIDCDTVTDCI